MRKLDWQEQNDLQWRLERLVHEAPYHPTPRPDRVLLYPREFHRPPRDWLHSLTRSIKLRPEHQARLQSTRFQGRPWTQDRCRKRRSRRQCESQCLDLSGRPCWQSRSDSYVATDNRIHVTVGKDEDKKTLALEKELLLGQSLVIRAEAVGEGRSQPLFSFWHNLAGASGAQRVPYMSPVPLDHWIRAQILNIHYKNQADASNHRSWSHLFSTLLSRYQATLLRHFACVDWDPGHRPNTINRTGWQSSWVGRMANMCKDEMERISRMQHGCAEAAGKRLSQCNRRWDDVPRKSIHAGLRRSRYFRLSPLIWHRFRGRGFADIVLEPIHSSKLHKCVSRAQILTLELKT